MPPLEELLEAKATVDLYIGRPPNGYGPTFCVPASVLLNLSPSLLHTHEKSALHAPGNICMKFEDDSKKAWELLLYWAYNHELPGSFTLTNGGARTALDAWILGERWTVPAFQDAIMKKLLHGQDEIRSDLLGTRSANHWSELGYFLAEQVVYRLLVLDYAQPQKLYSADLESISGKPGFITDLVDALERYRTYGRHLFKYFPGEHSGREERWRCFMVSEDKQGHEVQSEVIFRGVDDRNIEAES